MHTFRSILIAATAALALTVAAAPAQAQLIKRHNDGSLSFDPLLCLTDYQVRQALAQRGFTNIYLTAPTESIIGARATMGKYVYLIDFNICTNHIVSQKVLRPA